MRLRELSVTYRPVANAPGGPRPQLLTAADAAKVLRPLLADRPIEHFGILSLDSKHRVIGWDVIGIGTLDATIVHPRDVFRVAILQNAAAIIVAHNHPSGDPAPSPDDLALTRRLTQAAEVIGIPILDHIIIGNAHDDGPWFASLRERGELT
jgi:DNA repair protein RadC